MIQPGLQPIVNFLRPVQMVLQQDFWVCLRVNRGELVQWRELLIPERCEALAEGRPGRFPFLLHTTESSPVAEEIHPAGVVLLRGRAGQVEVQVHILHELEKTLAERGKEKELAALRADAVAPGSIMSVRQQVPMGLGHAIWCARAFIADDPFAILLPDDLMQCEVSCTAQLADAYRETGGNVVAIEEVPRDRVNRYGVLDVAEDRGRLVSVKGLVEKPPIEKAPSNLTIIGRYVLMPEVIGHLARMEKGAGGEVQLTDSMAKLIGTQPFHGLRYQGRRFDCGDKAGFLEAQVAFALARPDLAPAMRDILKRYA
jgi:UTP--glucose-1-phosphate uridylyltransferase